MRAHVWRCSSKGYWEVATKASDEDPPETLVLKRGRKQVCCVGPCSRSLKSDSRKTRAKTKQRRRVICTGTTDKGVVLLSFPLSWNPLLYRNLFVCWWSVSRTLWCCSLCHGVEGQRHPWKPHLVCQQFSQPTVHHPLPICCPSATTLCPVPNPLFRLNPTVCPSLPLCLKVSTRATTLQDL